MLHGSLIGYGMFYFCRKNISVALPLLSRDLGFSNAELGVLGSLLYVSYGLSKASIGLVALCMLSIYNRLRDRPEELGLAPIEVYRDDPEVEEESPEEEQLSYFNLVVRRVLTNPFLLLLATASLCVYVVRYGTLDWSTKYLVEVKGMGVGSAGALTSLIEFFGIPGITGLFSYVGAIISSAGTGAILDRWGWGGGFALWIVCAGISVLLLLPLWNARGRKR